MVGARAGVLRSCVLVRRMHGVEICKLSDSKEDCRLVSLSEQPHRLTVFRWVFIHFNFFPQIF